MFHRCKTVNFSLVLYRLVEGVHHWFQEGADMQAPSQAYKSFDRVAHLYDATRPIPAQVLHETARLLIADAELGAGTPFLDAGVGTGRFARPLAESGAWVVGVDVSAKMLSRLCMVAPRVSPVRADLRYLPFAEAAFGGALIVHVLHLIADWKRVVNEIRRVLIPGTSLYLGSEIRKRPRALTIYFDVARERGLIRPHLGAQSFEEVLDYLQNTGAELSQIDGGRLHWTITTNTRQVLEGLRPNIYSSLWETPMDIHAQLLKEVEQRVRGDTLDGEEEEETPAHLVLWRARWSL